MRIGQRVVASAGAAVLGQFRRQLWAPGEY
jgi:hypothetical protein